MGCDWNAFLIVTNHLHNLNIHKGLVQGQNLKHITINSLSQIIERLNNCRSLLVVDTDLIAHQKEWSKKKNSRQLFVDTKLAKLKKK